MTVRGRLTLPRAVRREIVAHARRDRPIECCGLIVGTAGRAMFVVPMINTEKSRVRYRIDDKARIELRRTLRGMRPGLSIIGVYHSHPAGKAWPSATDIAEAMYPDWVYLIVGLGTGRAVLRAFQIGDRGVRSIIIVS